MCTRYKLYFPLFMLLACVLVGCDSGPKFAAPEIDPPSDLIPAYLPKGYKLVSGFQLIPDSELQLRIFGDGLLTAHRKGFRNLYNLKSVNGNVIQGVYYRGKHHLILITKSYFPGGSLAQWRADFEASNLDLSECECLNRCWFPRLALFRFYEIQEEHTLSGVQVIILKGPMGLVSAFMRGDYLLTVESGISLDEILKIVTSLLEISE